MIPFLSSLRARLIITSTIILIIFLGGLAFIIDRAYQVGLETQVEARLQSMVFSLLAAAEEGDAGWIGLPEEVAEPALNRVESGLYGAILAGASASEQAQIWRSRSSIGMDWPFQFSTFKQNEQEFSVSNSVDGHAFFYFSKGFAWELYSGETAYLTLVVLEDRKEFQAQLQQFRLTLLLGLTLVALLLILVQWILMRWGLFPIHRMEADLEKIEMGQVQLLPKGYPDELTGVTGKLNLLLKNERSQIEKYKHTMSDLAHSLKTPLAILQGWLDDPDRNLEIETQEKDMLNTQLSRMNQAVQYHLQRAIASGNQASATALPVPEVMHQILGALEKVFSDKNIKVTESVGPEVVFWGVKGDLMELLGNLIENAFKYTKNEVHISAKGGGKDEVSGVYLPFELCVDDNGPGIPEKQRCAILERGTRLDTQVSGQGIGLAVVKDIIENYQGEILISTSALGGARFQCKIPSFACS